MLLCAKSDNQSVTQRGEIPDDHSHVCGQIVIDTVDIGLPGKRQSVDATNRSAYKSCDEFHAATPRQNERR